MTVKFKLPVHSLANSCHYIRKYFDESSEVANTQNERMYHMLEVM